MEILSADRGGTGTSNLSAVAKIKLTDDEQGWLGASKSGDSSSPEAEDFIDKLRIVGSLARTKSTSENKTDEFPDLVVLTAAGSSVMSGFDGQHRSETSPLPSSLLPVIPTTALDITGDGCINGTTEMKETNCKESLPVTTENLTRLSVEGRFSFREGSFSLSEGNDVYWEDSGSPFEYSLHADLNNNGSSEPHKEPDFSAVENLGHERRQQHTSFMVSLLHLTHEQHCKITLFM
jgi:hypothetical protein